MSRKSLLQKIKQFLRLKKRLPCLPYIETHLADHCNLKCIGCTHYSPLADEHFTDVNVFENDMNMLSKKLRFERIRLLGGEPLLHPQINKFIEITRENFPKARIFICTNGILLPSMDEEFWETCRRNNILFDMSRYTVNYSMVPKYAKLIRSKGLKVNWVHKGQKMWVFHNPLGNSNEKIAFERCAIKYYRVIILREGKIYICPKTAYLDIYNKFFKLNIPRDKGKSIYKCSAKEIVKYLDKPIKTCKYCTYFGKWVEWQNTEKTKEEWNTFSEPSMINKFQNFALRQIKKEKTK